MSYFGTDRASRMRLKRARKRPRSSLLFHSPVLSPSPLLDWTVLLWACIVVFNVYMNLLHRLDTQRYER